MTIIKRAIYSLAARYLYVLIAFSLAATASVLAAGGDFSLKFAGAAPKSYDHLTGGGAYDDGTVGKSADIVQSLEGGDFACGDVVTFFLLIQNSASPSSANQTIEVLLRFTGDSTGQSGVGQIESVDVALNYGISQDLIEGPHWDTGMIDNTNSTVTTSTVFVGTPYTSGSYLDVTNRITNLEAGEQVVLRVYVRLGCKPGTDPTGNLQADLINARVVEEDGQPVNSTICPNNRIVRLGFTGEHAGY